jgi:hypothetical protein
MKNSKYILQLLRSERIKTKEFCDKENRSYRLAIHGNKAINVLCDILEDEAECCNNCIYSSNHDDISCTCNISKETEPLVGFCDEFKIKNNG